MSRINIQKFLKTLPEGEADYCEGMRRMYGHLYERALEKAGKEMFLDKVPRYAYAIPELYKTFPEARYIFLLRHPFAVLNSIFRDWTGYHPDLLSAHTYAHDLISVPAFLIDGIRLLKEKAVTVHYEKVVANPREEIQRIVDRLGLDFVPSMIEYGSSGLPQWDFGDTRVYDHDRPVAAKGEAWKGALKDPLLWRLAKQYLSILGKETLETLGYDYEDTAKNLSACTPSRASVWLGEIIWRPAGLFRKIKKIVEQVIRHLRE